MTLGEKVRESRKRAGMTRDALASGVGISPAAVSKIEGDALEFGPRPEILIRIAELLNDQSILVYSLMSNPICQKIIPRAFEPLTNIKADPSAVLVKLQEELEEAIEAAKILSRVFAHAEPERTPMFKDTLFHNLEQILDVARNIEELVDKLKAGGALTEDEHLQVHISQQAKCERNGHHRPMVERRELQGRRATNGG